MDMNEQKILGMSKCCFAAVVGICLIGIVIGSMSDFSINVALANKTELGVFFATYGSYLSYCLYPAAGMCLFMGLRAKGPQFNALAWALLVVGCFMAVYYSNGYNGEKVRQLFGYTAGESSPLLSVASWLFWVVLYAWIPFVVKRLMDDRNPDMLIAVGAAILVAGITADNVNLWLKQVASRPRYKYLITLDDPRSGFRQWWQMIPNLARGDDNFKSWPSGNMTIAAMMFALLMLTNALKNRSARKNAVAFGFACFYVAIYGYNRIHMTNHFLSDVCFGTLITYLIFSGIGVAFMKAVRSLEPSR
jgi:membrane-associated phospholipid phosphatase